MKGLWWWRAGSSERLLRPVLFNIFIHNWQSTQNPQVYRYSWPPWGSQMPCQWQHPAGSHKIEQKARWWHRSFSIDKCRVEEDNPNQSSLMLMMELSIMAQERGLKLLLRVAWDHQPSVHLQPKKANKTSGKQQEECWGKDKRCHFFSLCSLSMTYTESNFHAWSLTENRNIPLTISVKD